MTPDTRAARDRLAAYLDGADQHAADWADTYRRGEFIHSTNTRRPAYAGEPDIPSVGLRWDDLRLLLAALDKRENAGEPLSAGEPHQVTMRLASDGFPFPHDTQHPAACDLLRYGQHCPFDQLLDEGHAFPDAPGVFTARIVPAREPERGDVYTEEPEIHYERTGDA